MQKVLIVGLHSTGAPLKLPGIDRGKTTGLGGVFTAHKKARRTKRSYTSVERCNGAKQLVRTIKTLHERHGPIGILDILDHGAPGGIMLGDEILFQSDDKALIKGQQTPKQLVPFLADTAHIRLLGCETGLGVRGQRLVWELGQAFGGHRVVSGTINRVLAGHFTKEDGFTQEMELLFSSLAALDWAAPHSDERLRNILNYYP